MSKPRPFRFGAALEFVVTSRSQLVHRARKIEDLGYAICVIPDHFGESLEPGVALTAMADATKTLRIGSFVYDNDFRHPALLAREASSLDLLSEGRFELGIGAGWAAEDYTTTGIPFDPPGVRISRLIESVQIIKQLFTGEAVTFSGNYYQVTGLINPPPVQSPHPPLVIGGGGKRILTFAAREANVIALVVRSQDGGLDFMDSAHAATVQRVQWIREAAGNRLDSLELNTLVFEVAITDHRQEVGEELARKWQVTPDHILNSTHYLVGTVSQIIEDIQRWREQFGISYVTVFPYDLDKFAPIVSHLAGS